MFWFIFFVHYLQIKCKKRKCYNDLLISLLWNIFFNNLYTKCQETAFHKKKLDWFSLKYKRCKNQRFKKIPKCNVIPLLILVLYILDFMKLNPGLQICKIIVHGNLC